MCLLVEQLFDRPLTILFIQIHVSLLTKILKIKLHLMFSIYNLSSFLIFRIFLLKVPLWGSKKFPLPLVLLVIFPIFLFLKFFFSFFNCNFVGFLIYKDVLFLYFFKPLILYIANMYDFFKICNLIYNLQTSRKFAKK